MKNDNLDKREFNKFDDSNCSKQCPYFDTDECDFYLVQLECVNERRSREDREYKRCIKCLKDVNPNPNSQLIQLMQVNNALLQTLINKINK